MGLNLPAHKGWQNGRAWRTLRVPGEIRQLIADLESAGFTRIRGGKGSHRKFVQWSDEDGACVGYSPDLFPAGGVCHADSAVEAYSSLCELVAETVASAEAQSLALPQPRTRPMMEPLLA